MCTLTHRGKADKFMGLNHQLSSLSCGIMDAYDMNRSFVFPAHICIPRVHAGPYEAKCVSTADIFDFERLKILNVVPFSSSITPTQMTKDANCHYPHIYRIAVKFGFQLCTSKIVPSVPRKLSNITLSLHTLRSGLFFSPKIRRVANHFLASIPDNFIFVHVRRSDKLTDCSRGECE